MEKINVTNTKDMELFNEILDDNLKLLFGSSNPAILEAFKDRVLNRIKTLEIYPWNYHDYYVNAERHGITDFSKSGNTAIKMYGLEGAPFNQEYIERIFSHELWHALMTILNNMYGSYFERKICYKKDNYKVGNYSGFLECSSEKHLFSPGVMMADSLAQVLALAVVKKNKNEDFIIDDVFNYGIKESLNSPVDDLLTFFQLFVSSFSLTYVNWMNLNYEKGKGLMDSTITNYSSKVITANIFISDSFKNPIAVMDEFDRFTFKGAYVDLLKKIDYLYSKYIEEGIIDTKGFIKVARRLNEFNRVRLFYYLDSFFITLEEYNKLTKIFDEHYKAFMKELGAYKIESCKMKFKKIVNKTVKKRIK